MHKQRKGSGLVLNKGVKERAERDKIAWQKEGETVSHEYLQKKLEEKSDKYEKLRTSSLHHYSDT